MQYTYTRQLHRSADSGFFYKINDQRPSLKHDSKNIHVFFTFDDAENARKEISDWKMRQKPLGCRKMHLKTREI